MPIPAIAAAAGAAALPYVLKIPKYAKMLYKSKNFVPALLGAGYFGSMGLEAVGQAGERGLTREQLRLQTLMQKASGVATERGVKESRAKTKEYIKALMKAKRDESKEVQELVAMQSFTESQNRQMAMVIQAIQVMGGRQMGSATQSPGAGMVGLMRGGF
jgi:hypothetical protein